jgi:hypothetical protein
LKELSSEPYYAAASAPPHLPISDAERRIDKVIAHGDRQVVSDTVKQWNKILRENVRAATALKLNGETVPIAVIDGMPKPLADATADIETWQWWMVLNRPSFEQTGHGLQLLLNQRERLTVNRPGFFGGHFV